MKLERVLHFAHDLAKKAMTDNSLVIDATCGNGHDSLFMARLLKTGKLYAFDIQEQAINNTRALLTEHEQIDKAELIQSSHEFILEHVQANSVDLVMFNLGYLPGADKSKTTTSHSSISAIKNSLLALKKNGLVVIVLYPGHEEGRREAQEVESFIETLDFKAYQAIKYGFINNSKRPPYIIAIEKVK